MPVPHSQQQTPSEEYDSEEEEDYELPDVDLGQEEEEDENAERGTSLPVRGTPLPDEETPLPGGYLLLPETPQPMPETPPQSEGMMTLAQARGGGGELRHIPAARTSRLGGRLAEPLPPARESTGRAGQEQQGLLPARESTGQDQERTGLEDEDELMLRRGTLRPHGEDEEGQEGPTEEKRVYNRGERRKHDDEWEKPLLKRIKHLRELTMRSEAARARKKFKQAVTALSVMSYETGQNNLYRTLVDMTDGQLLAALEAGSIELSISGATPLAHQPTPPTPQPTSSHPAAPSGNLRNQPAQPASPPSQPKKEANPLQQQQQAGPLDRHQGWERQQWASQGQQSKDSLAQPGTSSQNQLKEDQPAVGSASSTTARGHA
jgi:hypothetical protein